MNELNEIQKLNSKFDKLNKKYVSLDKKQSKSNCEIEQDILSIKMDEVQCEMSKISSLIEEIELNEIQPKYLTEDQIFQLRMDVIINTETCTGVSLEVFDNDLVFYCEHMHQAEEIKKYRNKENGVIVDGKYTLTYKELSND